MLIRAAVLEDAASLAEIYRPFVLDTTISYELVPPDADEMAARIEAKQQAHDWLVLEEDGRILAYAYYGVFRERPAYRHMVESSIYLAPTAQGRGLGRALYTALIASARQRAYREMLAVIALPNPASVGFHERLGFLPAGVLPRSGHKFGAYLDTGFWQLPLFE